MSRAPDRRRRLARLLALLPACLLVPACATAQGGKEGDADGPGAAPARRAVRVAVVSGVQAADDLAASGPDPLDLLADALTRLSTDEQVDAVVLLGDMIAPGASRDTLAAVLDTASGLPVPVLALPGANDLAALAPDAGAAARAPAAFGRLVDERWPPPAVGDTAPGAAKAAAAAKKGPRCWLRPVGPGLFVIGVDTAAGGVAGGDVPADTTEQVASWLGALAAKGEEAILVAVHPLADGPASGRADGAAAKGAAALRAAVAKSGACRLVVTGGADRVHVESREGLTVAATPPLARWPMGFRIATATAGGEGALSWLKAGSEAEREAARAATADAAEREGRPQDREGALPGA